MFKLVAERRAWWPVTFPGVAEDGSIVENTFELRFTVHGEDEFYTLFDEALQIGRDQDAAKAEVAEALTAAAGGGEAEAPRASPRMSELYTDFVEKVATDWRGVAAENGESLPWDRANLRAVMNVPGAFQGVLSALVACRRALPKEREGN